MTSSVCTNADLDVHMQESGLRPWIYLIIRASILGEPAVCLNYALALVTLNRLFLPDVPFVLQ